MGKLAEKLTRGMYRHARGVPVEVASGFITTDSPTVDDATTYFMACKTDQTVCESGMDLHAVDKSGGVPRLLVSAGNSLTIEAVGTARLYVAGEIFSDPVPRRGFIAMLPKTGGEPVPVVLGGGMQASRWLAVEPDDSAPHWADALTDDVGVFRCP